MKKVSIVMPFYDVEAYVGECLESLVGQTHENIEIICVDDCSPDRSIEIVEAYASRDQRIRVIRHEDNKGLGGARNTGIVASTGEYICFVDSDDYVSPRFVEVLLAEVEREQADMAVCGFTVVRKGGRKGRTVKPEKFAMDLSKDKSNVFEIVKSFRGGAPLKIYRRDLLLQHRIFQPEHRYHQGVHFWLACAYHSNRVSAVPEALYFYRNRPGSITTTFSFKHIDDRIAFMKQIDDFLNDTILASGEMDRERVRSDAYSFLLGHARYGRTMIEEAVAEDQEAYDKYYYQCLESFSDESGWRELLNDCYSEVVGT